MNSVWTRRALIAVLLATLVLCAMLLFKLYERYAGEETGSAEIGGPFALVNQDGKPVTDADFKGKLLLVYFGYTFCPDACPTTMAELKKVPPALGRSADDVQVVMISVDPQRDTPEVLREYLAHFDPSFLGLTGTEEEILAAATPLGIYYYAHEGSAASGYLVDHTTSVLAIDREGYLRVIYSFETPGEDIAADMRWLVRQWE